MAIDRQDSPYRRGNRYDRLPIPMIEEHCLPVDGGAVSLVVESRRLTTAIVEETYQGSVAAAVPFDDGGATREIHFEPAKFGLKPDKIYKFTGADFAKNGETYVGKVPIKAQGHTLVEVTEA